MNAGSKQNVYVLRCYPKKIPNESMKQIIKKRRDKANQILTHWNQYKERIRFMMK
ncbi:hypothetical protein JNUCC42_09525 [Brevibacterium sp. JNUCC-42]|nr:hypothetical protein [Brevibacillus laterosporus]QOT00878.1 hypothetical protein JNUCC42_09525 [Brevibacterium sp. JNUCC-42]RAP24006.1 hypothetical protein C2W64_02966 [Brevibacillus laterosporus]